MNSINEIADLAWLAGIIDGEGCIFARKVNKVANVDCRVAIQAASIRMIDDVSRIYDRYGIAYTREMRTRPRHNRSMHKVDIWRRAHVCKLLRLLLPYLRVKDREAEVVLEWFGKFPNEKPSGSRKSTFKQRMRFIETVKRLKKTA